MKSVESHYNDVVTMGRALPATSVSIANAQNLVLAEDTFSRISIPAFTSATLGGYAVRAADVIPGETLPVKTDISLDNKSESPSLSSNTAIRVLKGSPLPFGADAVIPVRKSRMLLEGNGQYPDSFTPTMQVEAGANIRRKGEEVEAGSLAFSAGTVLSAPHISSLIAVGNTTVNVHRRPIVGILAPGTPKTNGEETGNVTSPSANVAMAVQLIAHHGGLPRVCPVYGASTEEIGHQIREIAASVDYLIMPGGISGDVSRLLKKTLLEMAGIHFDEVALQPGKSQGWGILAITSPASSQPYGFTTLEAHLVPILCLPNNPISTFVSIHLFALPLLEALMGYPTRSFTHLFKREILGASWRHKVGREQFMPVIRGRDGRVVPAHTPGEQTSHLLSTIPTAEGLARVGTDVARVREGEEIDVFWFSR
ncbi:MAG: molybdopterin molybdotransferase MoeA [Actinomycetaceae bacterium]|nr:molybdopterin molybdotransferase MoeA [Actinomycetaceae bacterium]